MKLKRMLYFSIASLALMLACVVPGVGGQGAPVIPTSVPGEMETAIAGTASAAAAMTSAAASPTPSPTITPTPTITPRVLEGTDSTLIKSPDGSTQFIDKVAGYSIVIPAGWVTVRINQPEYYEAWALPAMANPERQKFLNTLKSRDPNLFHLAAIDIRDEHLTESGVTSILFGWLQDENISLDTDEDMQRLSNEDTSSDLKPQAVSAYVSTTPSGIKVGIIEWEIDTGAVVVYQKGALLPRATGGSTAIWISTDSILKDVLLPEFDAMLATISIQ